MSSSSFIKTNYIVNINAIILALARLFMITKLIKGWALLPYWDHWNVINSGYKWSNLLQIMTNMDFLLYLKLVNTQNS